jgi:uncharacterized protein
MRTARPSRKVITVAASSGQSGSLAGLRLETLISVFWHACVAGQRRAAERLLSAGADLNWEPDYAEGTALDAATGLGTRRENVIEWLRSIGARSAQTPE